MKMNWADFIGRILNITLHENYGMTMDTKSDSPFYEIVFTTGKLIQVYDEGLFLETEREMKIVNIFIPHSSIKCVEIYSI